MRHDLPEPWEENDQYEGRKPGLFSSYGHLAVFVAIVFGVFYLIWKGIEGVWSILGG